MSRTDVRDLDVNSIHIFDKHVDAYEAWFEEHPEAYASGLEAVRALLPRGGVGLEVGVGTGRVRCAPWCGAGHRAGPSHAPPRRGARGRRG